MADRLVTIANFANPIEAQMAKDGLEDAGTPAALEDANMGTLYGGAVGAMQIRLVVRSEDAERAREILASLEE